MTATGVRIDYDVALSFAGEDREYAEQIAHELTNLGVKVFYDRFEEADLWGKDLYAYLSDLYKNRAQYTVVFVSRYYAEKLWTNHERRSAQARALAERAEYILPLRLDETDLPGILPTIGYVKARKKTAAEIAALIAKKLSLTSQNRLGRL